MSNVGGNSRDNLATSVYYRLAYMATSGGHFSCPLGMAFKTDTVKVGLVFLISHFFITKTARANKWMRKKIPSCSNSALVFCLNFQELRNII